MANLLRVIWRWVQQCTCRHDWKISTYKHKGYGIARCNCVECDKEVVYEFHYEDEDA